MSRLAVFVALVAMLVGGGSMLLGLVVIAVIVVVGSLPVVVRRCLMVRGSIVVVLASRMFLFLCHGNHLRWVWDEAFTAPSEVRSCPQDKVAW